MRREKTFLYYGRRKILLDWKAIKNFTVGGLLKYCLDRVHQSERFPSLLMRQSNVGIYFVCRENYDVNTRINSFLRSGKPVFLINLPTTVQSTERIISLADVESSASNMVIRADEENEEEQENPEIIVAQTFSWLLTPLMHTNVTPPGFIQTLPDIKKVINKHSYERICREVVPNDFFCVICQTDSTDEKIVEIQVCGHTFHDVCIKEWLTRQNITCAYCRKDTVTESKDYGYVGINGSDEFTPANIYERRPDSISRTGLPAILNMFQVTF